MEIKDKIKRAKYLFENYINMLEVLEQSEK
jgi:hypothetical protein